MELKDFPANISRLRKEVVALENCFVCGGYIDGGYDIPSANIHLYLKTICEVVGLKDPEIEAIVEKHNNVVGQISFCEKCRLNLEMFRDTQLQLQSLSLQISQIKITLSEDLCGELQIDISARPSSELRTALANEYECRARGPRKSLKTERILGDFDYEDSSLGSPVNLNLLHGQEYLDSNIADQWNLKPCQVDLVRIEPAGASGQFDYEDERRRHKRLRKLLKRQGAKLFESPSRRQRKELKLRRAGRGPGRPKSSNNIKLIPSVKCTQCHHRTHTEELLRFHVRRNHEGKHACYNCSTCDAEFELLSRLRRHENEAGHHVPNLDQEKIECKQCHRMFLKNNYDIHLERQGGACKRYVSLPLNSTFDRSQIKRHRFVCGECGKKYRSPHHLGIHIRATHTDGFAFMCEYCSKPYQSKQSLLNHQQKIHLEEVLASQPNTEAVLAKVNSKKCQICQITFTSNVGKRNHDAKAHKNSCSFYCEVCGSPWYTRTALKQHMVSHTEDRNFPCSICGFKFARRDKMLRHVRTKHGDGSTKTFVCKHCQKGFYDKTALNRHVTLMHISKNDSSSSLFTFRCDPCDYTCVIKDYLRIHVRTKKHLQRVAAVQIKDDPSF